MRWRSPTSGDAPTSGVGVPARRGHRGPFAPAVLAVVLVGPAPAAAFHEQGVAACSGCHTIHNSVDGAVGTAGDPGPWLLRGENATEVCLNCHAEGHGAVLGPVPTSPPPELGAGNFTFLLEDNLNDGAGGAPPIGGHRAGHSIVAPSRNLDPDPELLTAPGGFYPSDELGCTSCHDPHGNAAFRMLRGAGPAPGGFVFLYPPPEADGIDVATEVETRTRHTAYRSGWTDWCANCHGTYHEGATGFQHVVDRAMGSTARVYDAYDGPSNPDGGFSQSAYLPEVPFEDPAVTVDGTAGPPSGSARVTCLTCHRAHATSAPAALRWDPNVLRLGDDGLASFSYPIPNPYVDPEQRALCVKCHYPEAVAHGMAQPCMECHRFGGGTRLGPGFASPQAAPGGTFRR